MKFTNYKLKRKLKNLFISLPLILIIYSAVSAQAQQSEILGYIRYDWTTGNYLGSTAITDSDATFNDGPLAGVSYLNAATNHTFIGLDDAVNVSFLNNDDTIDVYNLVTGDLVNNYTWDVSDTIGVGVNIIGVDDNRQTHYLNNLNLPDAVTPAGALWGDGQANADAGTQPYSGQTYASFAANALGVSIVNGGAAWIVLDPDNSLSAYEWNNGNNDGNPTWTNFSGGMFAGQTIMSVVNAFDYVSFSRREMIIYMPEPSSALLIMTSLIFPLLRRKRKLLLV